MVNFILGRYYCLHLHVVDRQCLVFLGARPEFHHACAWNATYAGTVLHYHSWLKGADIDDNQGLQIFDKDIWVFIEVKVGERFETAVLFWRKHVGDLVSIHFFSLGSIDESNIFETINKGYELTNFIFECSFNSAFHKVTLFKVECDRELWYLARLFLLYNCHEIHAFIRKDHIFILVLGVLSFYDFKNLTDLCHFKYMFFIFLDLILYNFVNAKICNDHV